MGTSRIDPPRPLADALARGRLTILAGAGISMWTPSNLPGWTAYNEIELDEVRQAAVRGVPDALAAEIGCPPPILRHSTFIDVGVNIRQSTRRCEL